MNIPGHGRRATVDAPEAQVTPDFGIDPIAWLARERLRQGPVVWIRGAGPPVFSRLPDCRAVVAVLAAPALQQVLDGGGSFVMPASAASRAGLRGSAVRLNHSLHSMEGAAHAAHRRALAALLGRAGDPGPLLRAAARRCISGWPRAAPQPLLARLRELSLAMAQALLLGEQAPLGLAPLLLDFFLQRRAAATTGASAVPGAAVQAAAVEPALRALLRSGGDGLLCRLLDPEATAGLAFEEDEALGHANILFVSATEPVAIALAWTLILLSQSAHWRARARADPVAAQAVLHESLRLLPPNAFMVRVCTRPLQLGAVALPADSEVIICPLLTHRDPEFFADPAGFAPERWKGLRPSPWQYLPFGAGGHACIGRGLALAMLQHAFTALLERADTLLDSNAPIDWRQNVQFMPREEVMVRFEPPGGRRRGARWCGPVAALVQMHPPRS